VSIRSTGGRSAELSWDSLTDVPADKTIRCRRDYMIVEPLKVDHGTMIEVIEHTKPLRGIVKAVGPGCYPKRYDHPDKHRRTKTWDSRAFLPTQVRVGDVVELGGYEYGGYAFQTFVWGDKEHLICRELDVSGVVEFSDSKGICIHRHPISVGYQVNYDGYLYVCPDCGFRSYSPFRMEEAA
jgi:co-chaperonin GroES (HSP10)